MTDMRPRAKSIREHIRKVGVVDVYLVDGVARSFVLWSEEPAKLRQRGASVEHIARYDENSRIAWIAEDLRWAVERQGRAEA